MATGQSRGTIENAEISREGTVSNVGSKKKSEAVEPQFYQA